MCTDIHVLTCTTVGVAVSEPVPLPTCKSIPKRSKVARFSRQMGMQAKSGYIAVESAYVPGFGLQTNPMFNGNQGVMMGSPKKGAWILLECRLNQLFSASSSTAQPNEVPDHHSILHLQRWHRNGQLLPLQNAIFI